MESKLALQKKSWAARTAGSLFALLLVCVMVLSLSACEGDKATTTGNTEKEVMYELRNVSGAPMVLDSGLDAGYWDNLDGFGPKILPKRQARSASLILTPKKVLRMDGLLKHPQQLMK